jgi:hypothetical protein
MGVGKNQLSRLERGSDSWTELSDRMLQQALRVCWKRLAREIEQLLEWRAFSLWTRAIVHIENAIPGVVQREIEERCPAFGITEMANRDLGSLWTDLLAWSEQFAFTEAKAGGWIEAAHYYSGLDPRSEQTWLHWERSVAEWTNQRPAKYPKFAEWWEATQSAGCGVAQATLVKAIEAIAFSYWAMLLLRRGASDNSIKRELELRCPYFLANHAIPAREDKNAMAKFRMTLEDALLGEFRDPERINTAAKNHLQTMRIAAYSDACRDQAITSAGLLVPAFQVWLQQADEFVVNP